MLCYEHKHCLKDVNMQSVTICLLYNMFVYIALLVLHYLSIVLFLLVIYMLNLVHGWLHTAAVYSKYF